VFVVSKDNTSILDNDDWFLVELIEELEEINLNNKLAKLNASSMVGKDGLRILF
jgi:hypothetical protein